MGTTKRIHEIRDPVHGFIRMDSEERNAVDSRPVQRLRHIHQLSLSYLVYPAATHRRFEHSLGVMELASRVFDVVTDAERKHAAVWDLMPELRDPDKRAYWRRVLRMAALCHDLGHLPFSHGAEKELLPPGWDHERLTHEIIRSPEMMKTWEAMTPPLRADDLAKLALGPSSLPDTAFTQWESILSEIIVGEAFGVDRMDYLLRDSHHIGVAYGRFDHYRLVDTLRILPPPPAGQGGESREPALGIEEGGLHSAEALLLARYFMYTQVYFHPVRRVYDVHLRDFLAEWLAGGRFPTEVELHLKTTDNEVLAALSAVARDPDARGFEAARRIAQHDHFRCVYETQAADVKLKARPGEAVYTALCAKFGAHNVRRDVRDTPEDVHDFPVLLADDSVASAHSVSDVLTQLPAPRLDRVYVPKDLRDDAQTYIREHRESIPTSGGGQEA